MERTDQFFLLHRYGDWADDLECVHGRATTLTRAAHPLDAKVYAPPPMPQMAYPTPPLSPPIAQQQSQYFATAPQQFAPQQFAPQPFFVPQQYYAQPQPQVLVPIAVAPIAPAPASASGATDAAKPAAAAAAPVQKDEAKPAAAAAPVKKDDAKPAADGHATLIKALKFGWTLGTTALAAQDVEKLTESKKTAPASSTGSKPSRMVRQRLRCSPLTVVESLQEEVRSSTAAGRRA